MFDDLNIITVLDLAGTFAFAISGIRLASRKKMDWFGAFIIGLVTAIGGGTTRDLLLGVTPFWMEDARYFITTAVALGVTLLFKEKLFRWGITLFLFDAIGLGLFTIVGISKSLDAGLAFWVCILMGTITGSAGGVYRDILLNEVPLIFRRDIYALASVIGGIIYFLAYQFQILVNFSGLFAALTVIAIRILAVRLHIHLPVLKPLKPEEEEN